MQTSWPKQAPILRSLCLRNETLWVTAHSHRITRRATFSNERRGWMEAAIGVRNDVAAAQDKVSRVMVMFSEGIGATTTLPEDIGVRALDLGIPIYPFSRYVLSVDGRV